MKCVKSCCTDYQLQQWGLIFDFDQTFFYSGKNDWSVFQNEWKEWVQRWGV